MMLVQPFQQGTAGVQRQPQRIKRFENLQKRQVTVLIRLFENTVKIADRLVVVKDQTEADWICHRSDGAGRGTGRNRHSNAGFIAHAQKVIGTAILA